jgi:hypothetical protein
MRPRAFLFGVAFALAQTLSFANAQQVDKLPSVGVLLTSPFLAALSSIPPWSPRLTASVLRCMSPEVCRLCAWRRVRETANINRDDR